MKIVKVRTAAEARDAAQLMRGLYEANKALYADDLKTIEDYYRGSWFFADKPAIPEAYRPPHGDVLVAYREDAPAGAVAIYRMDAAHCELKSMFVAPNRRRDGVAAALCDAVIDLAREQGYQKVRLTTGEKQTAAHHLYRGLGFEIVTPWDDDPPTGYDYFELALDEGD